MYKPAPSVVLTRKYPSELSPATKEAMQSAFGVQSTFWDILRSSNVRHLTHSALELVVLKPQPLLYSGGTVSEK
jgi:hypothetical protein